ncbi:MAG: Asp-tRNA(Asn)/Glu-tRNA(Gln) amidotransferase GatCAB subunit C [Deltaproteobacteria bacterium]|nr:MAG: Asp-tRNA(Asn)/Glu-tRNA(Gln) amidotransferase GatCAB subunit C [Deltaproteobacteria bacterium]
MKISKEEVEHVASLARLEFSPAEIETFASQLSSILEYVEKLGELDLAGVEPTAHVHEIVNAFRDDVVTPGLTNEEALMNAPYPEDGCYRVAKVIEGE